jgi:SAM-dependent methyltransferase
MGTRTVTLTGRTSHGNLQKHQNPNRLQRLLIDRFHRTVTDLLRQTGAGRILDAGCGEGFFYQHLRRDGLPVSYIGSDISFDAVSWAKTEVGPSFNGQMADIHRLPFADAAFPLVVCLEVLEHIPDSSLGLRELARVSSGYLLLSVPHEPFFRGVNFLRGKHLTGWGNDPEHLHNYSGRAFRRLVSGVADLVWHGYSFPWQIALARKRPNQ